ncbi:hypothetical protein EXIGLDRAFT_696491 [Exidia glandulosa HHB12029]|uniref:Uncharacterized protein n=1 Tax=Exidia glandulosa HHB12029 TaxID=1314781 RepID=A0A166A5M1_EXIGL|nr:hypothetical protein EXIGLDRAFT_696491 [Exidia glandulosa HHB12029]
MRQNSLLLAVLAALFVALLVQASPTRPPSRPPSPASPIRPPRPPSRPPSPASPIKPPSKPVRKATKPPKTKPAAPPARGSGPSTSSSNQETATSRTEFLTTKAKCNTHTTCETCAGALKEVKVRLPGEGSSRKGPTVNARCAWQQATSDPQGKCIGIEVDARPPSPPLHLITDKKQCDALEQVVRAHQKQILKEKQEAYVIQLWNAMESHVLGTEDSRNAKSGTHVAGAWLDKNKQDALTVERVTQLAISVQNPAKTLWLDDPRTVDNRKKYPGPYFTAMDVENMCKAALIALVELLHDEGRDGRQSPTGSEHSSSGSTHNADTITIPPQNRAFSVESPVTHHNVCITIAPQKTEADYSCYPSNTKVTTTPVGKECTNFRGK